MRISDWSSDVCSSDLPFPHAAEHLLQVRVAVLRRRLDRAGRIELLAAIQIEPRGRRLPFLFGGQARAGPAREGVGLEEADVRHRRGGRSEEHTSELQSLMRISYAVFCLKKKKITSSHLLYSY